MIKCPYCNHEFDSEKMSHDLVRDTYKGTFQAFSCPNCRTLLDIVFEYG